MVTLTFVFNKDRVREDGYTEKELLRPMREYAVQHNISENEYGVFSKDGENAMCLLTKFVTDYTLENPDYIYYFDEWLLDVNGEIEDCIQGTLRWFKKRGIHSKVMVAG